MDLDYEQRINELEIKVEEFVNWCRSIRNRLNKESSSEQPLIASNSHSDDNSFYDTKNVKQNSVGVAPNFAIREDSV